MNKEPKNNKKEDWLEELQRESWHLELLVSGFSIFLLLQAYSGLSNSFTFLNLHVSTSGNINGIIRTFLGVLILGSIVLMCNLLLHVFIRGFWVGTVGLRSVQNKINIKDLGYSDFFTRKLQDKVPTLDKIQEKLDTLASVIFAFTFLIIFMFLSLFLYVAIASLFAYTYEFYIANNLDDGIIKNIANTIAISLLLAWLLMGVIYMIDTLSLGFFKKYRRLSKLYFPIYKIMGIVTLASMYRSIYYSLISRFPKRKLRIILLFYILLFVLLPFNKYDQYIYYPDNGTSFKLNDQDYDDARAEGENIWLASIPSKIINESYLPLFVRYQVSHNTILEKTCTEWKPLKKDGFNSGINIGSDGLKLGNAFITEEEPGKALDCLTDFYSVFLDSTQLDLDFYFYRHPNDEERGIITMIDIDTLPRGKYVIDIKRKEIQDDDKIGTTSYAKIPFWRE